MDGMCCAQEAQAWALVQFGHARLKDPRRTRRLVALAAAALERPDMSLPQQHRDWADLQAAYRFLSNDAVDAQDIIAAHAAVTRQAAASCPVLLCVQDDTTLDFTLRTGIQGLGMIGDGHGRGLLQHTGLAVRPDKSVLGILHLRYYTPGPAPEGETRRQRQSRWNVRDVWQETAQALGVWEGPRLLHVGDRHADLFRFFDICRSLGHGWVVRAQHDRWVDQDTQHLWEKLGAQTPLGTMRVPLGSQRNKGNQVQRAAREATLTIRVAPVLFAPGRNDPRTSDAPAIALWALYLQEQDPPAGGTPVEWMLLSSEAVTDLAQARQIIGYYTCRWVIEEFHRCLKEGCRIEAAQLDEAADLMRLGAILSPAAIRLLQLRDLAERASQDATLDTPEMLQRMVPALYLLIVAGLAKADARTFTPRQFLLTIAKRGGYLGRKHDPRPGWKVLWRGWIEIVQMVQGAELFQQLQQTANTSV